MADIIEFSTERLDGETGSQPEDDDDGFLLREGLELLALYRTIEDDAVRASIIHMVGTIARSGQRR